MRGNTANGPNIRRRRKRLGWTQEELASQADVDVKTVRNAELGRNLDVSTLQRIALALTVELSYIAVTSSDSGRAAQRRARIAKRWLKAFQEGDVKTMLDVYHTDAVLVCPNIEGLIEGGERAGKAQRQKVIQESAVLFNPRPCAEDSLRVHCAAEYVFVRGNCTVEVESTGKTFVSEILNEFQFAGDQVIRHTLLADTAAIQQAADLGG